MSRTEYETGTSSVPRANLPTVLTSFIGRKREIAEIRQWLASSRLVTLTGAAGCGKTRLALRVATDAGQKYADGVHSVELAPLTDLRLVSQAVAKAVNVVEQAGRPLMDGLSDALQDKQLLLVLDNCEHVLSACSQLAETLLAATEVSILATSREPLGITGERRYPVSPMALPPTDSRADDIGQFDAVELFIERARTILPAFELTASNGAEVVRICRHLDGIPLAIELASARINVLSVEQIAARLDHRFQLLSPAAHVTHSHHDTLRAAIDWSYDLLSTSEQVMLRRLSVFAGGCSLAAVEAVCAGDGLEREQALELLSSLINKSLVVAQTLQRSEARYALLETIRQYGREKLIAAGERSALQDRHLQCFLHLTEETRPKLTGQYQQLWLDWLEDEYDNIRAALIWSLENARLKSGHIEAGLRIAIAIYEFWTIRDYAEEALAWMERLLAQADEGISPLVRANALAYATFLAGFRGNSGTQAAYGRKAAALAEALGDEGQPALAWTRAGEAYAQDRPGPLPSGGSALVWALTAQAYGARAEGDYETEFTIYKKVIQLYREMGEKYFLGVALTTGGFAAMSLGKYEEARAMADEGLPLIRESGNLYRIAMTLNGSGDLARCERNYTRARAAYEESIALLRELDAVRDLASALHNLGHTVLHLGDVERAHELFSESMALQQAQHNTPGVAECLIGFAAMAAVCGLPAAGARLLAAAVAIGGERVATTWAATRLEYEHYLALIRASLTDAEFQAEQTAGSVFSLEQVVEYARNLPLQVAAQTTRKKPDDLTLREREVAALIALGRSNSEIADELVLSKRTVEKHIGNILSKLAFTNRVQIVRWAIESGLAKAGE
jgi:predicted ATPase/DNA-binding NarL/FixJ family response regulator